MLVCTFITASHQAALIGIKVLVGLDSDVGIIIEGSIVNNLTRYLKETLTGDEYCTY